MKLLALDPATRTGWAHSDGPHGIWDLAVKRDESAGMRLVRFRGKLNEIRRDLGVDLVVFEAARHAAAGMQGTLVCQAELQGVLKTWCEDNGVEYRGFSPSEIKKHATGKGNASKSDVLKAARTEAAQQRWGWVSWHDEADALWALDLARKEYENG
jgi:Holliday junction resolvasome RuvABC endonuclease subunit